MPETMRHIFEAVDRVFASIAPITDLLHRVESGQTEGASGQYYADGKGTLAGVIVPVELLRRLREAVMAVPKA